MKNTRSSRNTDSRCIVGILMMNAKRSTIQFKKHVVRSYCNLNIVGATLTVNEGVDKLVHQELHGLKTEKKKFSQPTMV